MMITEERTQFETNIVQKDKYEVLNYKNPRMQSLLMNPENLARLCDCWHDRSTDYELYTFLKINANYKTPYKQFNRRKGEAIFEIIPQEVKATVAFNYLEVLIKTSMDIGFVIKNDLIYGAFWTRTEEPELSVYMLMALTGTQYEKSKSVITMVKHFYNGYAKWLYKKGYKYILASSAGTISAGLLLAIRKKELLEAGAKYNSISKKWELSDPNLPNRIAGFKCIGERDFIRYHNKEIWTKSYSYNLEIKYGKSG